MMKKIFVVAPGVYFNGQTGDSVHLTKLWKSISKIDTAQVDIFCPVKNFNHETIKFHKSPYRRTRNSILNILFLLFSLLTIYFKLIYNLVLRKKPEIIYSRHQVFNPAFLIKKNKKIKYILEVNGFFAMEVKSQGIGFLNITSKLLRKIELKSFKKADKILVVASVMKYTLIEKYGIDGQKIKVISNGVDTNLFYPQNIDSINLDLPKDKKYICFVGNLIPWQGVETIIKSAKQNRHELLNYRYLIVGDGILKKKLVSMTKEYAVDDLFIFVGKVAHETVVNYINISEVCLAPFARERNSIVGFSAIKVFEYLACGKPIIASCIKGNNLEIISDNNFGYLIEPDNPDVLSSKIVTLLKDKILIDNTNNRAYNFVKVNYSWDNIGLKIYDEITK